MISQTTQKYQVISYTLLSLLDNDIINVNEDPIEPVSNVHESATAEMTMPTQEINFKNISKKRMIKSQKMPKSHPIFKIERKRERKFEYKQNEVCPSGPVSVYHTAILNSKPVEKVIKSQKLFENIDQPHDLKSNVTFSRSPIQKDIKIVTIQQDRTNIEHAIKELLLSEVPPSKNEKW